MIWGIVIARELHNGLYWVYHRRHGVCVTGKQVSRESGAVQKRVDEETGEEAGVSEGGVMSDMGGPWGTAAWELVAWSLMVSCVCSSLLSTL